MAALTFGIAVVRCLARLLALIVLQFRLLRLDVVLSVVLSFAERGDEAQGEKDQEEIRLHGFKILVLKC